MKAHVLQHASFEGLGSIASWLARKGAEVSTTRMFENGVLPSLSGVDLVIAMGGPMSVNDELAYPWLADEKRFIRDATDRGTPVLGVCLGSQLIASALGARVYRNHQQEIGWFRVEGIQGGDAAFRFPKEFRTFHWHGETFDLPPGAVHLASSTACRNQSFQVGRRTLGLQFHLEITREAARDFVEGAGAELEPSEYVQSAGEIVGAADACYLDSNRLMERVLDYLTAT